MAVTDRPAYSRNFIHRQYYRCFSTKCKTDAGLFKRSPRRLYDVRVIRIKYFCQGGADIIFGSLQPGNNRELCSIDQNERLFTRGLQWAGQNAAAAGINEYGLS